ncbi:MAG: YraN family protein [Clostridia bacterium]|nr:YraN family protein [Clostridia bacterium]
MDGRTDGVLGEVRAEQYLQEQGLRVIARNVHAPGAEIDLVAEDGSVIAFIEVKLRRSARGGLAREAVTPAKQRRICKGALYYMMKNGLMNRQARFDVLEIQGGRVTYIRNAFPYQGPSF